MLSRGFAFHGISFVGWLLVNELCTHVGLLSVGPTGNRVEHRSREKSQGTALKAGEAGCSGLSPELLSWIFSTSEVVISADPQLSLLEPCGCMLLWS